MKRFVIALVATVAVLLPAGSLVQAASCNGASHPQPMLSNGSANPGSGSAGTTITFSVVYADNAGCVPSSLTVAVTGVGTFGMATSGTNFTAGVTYLVTLAIPAGSHTYSFGATSGSGAGEKSVNFTAVQPAAVVMTNPTQARTPVPPPPPPPQPAPVPPPVVQPPPPPPPTAPPASESPSASASSSSSSSPSTTPAEGAPSPTGPDPTRDILPAAKVVGQRAAAKPSASSIFGGSDLPLLGTVMTYLWTTAAGLTLFAFLVRRRKASQPGKLSVAMAQSAVPATPSTVDHRVTPLPPMRDLIPPVDPYLLDVEERPGPVAGEADLPRWLRPSVRSGRRTRNPNRLSGRDD
jgi:hypothetical protein